MRNVKIAIAQLQGYWPEDMPVERRKQENYNQFSLWLEEAARRNPDIVVVGECFNHNHIPKSDRKYDEDLSTGKAFQIASKIASKYSCYIAYGINGSHEGVKRNATVIIDRNGKIVGMYFKTQLTRGEKDHGTIPGEGFPVFDLDFGKVGVLTCHDMSFPETARCLMLNGAELLLWPNMWSGWGEELCYAVIKSRCIDNSVHLVMASTGQNPKALNWVGGLKSLSAVFNYEGKIMAQKTDRLPGTLFCEIDLDFKRIAPWFTIGDEDPFLDVVLAERRPEIYGALTDPNLSQRRREQNSR